MPWGRSVYVFKVVSVVLVFFGFKLENGHRQQRQSILIASEVWSIGCKMIF